MESLLTVTTLAAFVVWLAVSVLIILNLSRLARSYRNSERILQRMLELMKESSNQEKAKRYLKDMR